MVNITDIMKKLNDLESGDHSISIQSKTLLDLPVEVIEMILSHLNLEDKKNFGLTCKKHNEIFSHCADLWKNVWIRVPEEETPKASELTRKYMNVKCKRNSFKQLADDGIFAHLAPYLKGLAVEYYWLYGYFHLHLSLKCLTSTLPFIENLIHWDFSGVDSLLDDIDESTAVDQNFQLIPVEMKKLKHLEMKRSVFQKLNSRFVNFSTSSLKTLILRDGVNHDEYDEKVIVLLVERQKDLEILKLFLNTGVIFDKPLKLEAQLRKIVLEFRESLNAEQQNNMCEFFDLQKGLQKQRIEWNGQKTDRSLNYQMRLLNSTVAEQEIVFLEHPGEQRNFWNIDSKKLVIDSYSTEFLSYSHQENLHTVNLTLFIELPTVAEVEAVITSICDKFPNLKDLFILFWGCGIDEAFASINLSYLGKLEKLESLKIEGLTSDSSSYRLLDNLTIPSLKKFVSYPRLLPLQSCIRVRNFMTRHVNLNCMEFRHDLDSEYLDPLLEAKAKVTEIFANSGINVKMKTSEYSFDITLSKGENGN